MIIYLHLYSGSEQGLGRVSTGDFILTPDLVCVSTNDLDEMGTWPEQD